MKTDKQLLEKSDDLEKKWLLLGFKGNLIDFLRDLVKSKLNKNEIAHFSGDDFEGEGTKEKPYKVKWRQSNGDSELEKRVKSLEDYIDQLQKSI